ncbi:hypothetical protein MVQ18_08740 [Fusobacterium necrophorum]|uniref:hypothetical protein n=1 Tax=Fusobacterium necrophorum TaxID=859 RepID=UPI00254F2EA5|nr:hypothetical protein [Fusobacterium necrophorum]MDK4516826.1 hypothetical protein [Fusobacterium necrophorum]
MQKIILCLFFFLSFYSFSSEDKIIVKSYLVLGNSNISIEKDAESLLTDDGYGWIKDLDLCILSFL